MFSLENYVIIVYVVPAVCLFVANQNRDTVASALYYKKKINGTTLIKVDNCRESISFCRDKNNKFLTRPIHVNVTRQSATHVHTDQSKQYHDVDFIYDHYEYFWSKK